MRSLHIAVAQVHAGGSIDENLERIERQVHAAGAIGVDAVLFSECALQGYGYESDLTSEVVQSAAVALDDPPCRRFTELAREHAIVVLAGFFERDGDHLYNSCLVAWPDGRREVERKRGLTKPELDVGLVRGEPTRRAFVINEVKCAVVICADSGIKGLHAGLADEGFDFRLCPTAGGGALADMLHETDLDTEPGRAEHGRMRAMVFKPETVLDLSDNHGIGFASANALGPVGTRTCHMGHCMVVDNRGVVRAQIPGTPVLEHQQDQLAHALLLFD